MPRFPTPTSTAFVWLFQPRKVSIAVISSATGNPRRGVPVIPVTAKSLRTITGSRLCVLANTVPETNLVPLALQHS